MGEETSFELQLFPSSSSTFRSDSPQVESETEAFDRDSEMDILVLIGRLEVLLKIEVEVDGRVAELSPEVGEEVRRGRT